MIYNCPDPGCQCSTDLCHYHQLPSKIEVIDIEKQNRLSKVILLHSKGLNQEEIAEELYIDQSTVCRDIQYIKHEAKIKIEKYLRDDILFEYVRYMAGSNEITRHLWEIVQDNNTSTREKTNALSCLLQSTIVVFKHLLLVQNHMYAPVWNHQLELGSSIQDGLIN